MSECVGLVQFQGVCLVIPDGYDGSVGVINEFYCLFLGRSGVGVSRGGGVNFTDG